MTTASRPAVSSQQTAVSMHLLVNGETRSLPQGATVSDLIRILELNEKLVAVEVNRQLVRKSTFADHRLGGGDKVEIVEFVGGG